MKRKNIEIIAPKALCNVVIKFIISILTLFAPIILALTIDLGLIGLLPACTLPLCYMCYLFFYLKNCSIEINYSDRKVTITKPFKTKTILIDNITWSAREVGARTPSFIIKITSNNKTIIKLRDDNWDNVKELHFLPHKNGSAERDCIKRSRQ